MARPRFVRTFLPAVLALSLTAAAQTTSRSATVSPPTPPSSPSLPTVHPDGSITFRLLVPGASSVALQSDAVAEPLSLTQSPAEPGVWTATTPPLPPEIYGYRFRVDGRSTLDSRNPHLRPNLLEPSNEILVPRTPPAPWELTAVPHGTLTTHTYTTHVAQHLLANQEPYVVYTPPGYDAHRPGGYPVLYLLHGWSDNVDGWSAAGRANLILDTLLAAGSITPMLVVMPQGYGDYTFVTSGYSVWLHPDLVDHNTSLYESMLLTEILPAVEHDYNVAKDRDHRAIAGLSMGGLETLTIGLHNPGIFAYVAGMSSALHGEHFDEHFSAFREPVAAQKANYKLLWVGCGTGDGLIQPNRDFVAWAKSKGLPVTAVETPGQHTWLVWRNNLITIAPLLFR